MKKIFTFQHKAYPNYKIKGMASGVEDDDGPVRTQIYVLFKNLWNDLKRTVRT